MKTQRKRVRIGSDIFESISTAAMFMGTNASEIKRLSRDESIHWIEILETKDDD